MKKIACLFPGIGYTCDKPLLYYSWKLLKGMGWEIITVQYTGFPSGVKGNAEKMQQCAHMALEQSEELLQGIDWTEYSDTVIQAYDVWKEKMNYGKPTMGVVRTTYTPCRIV